jgi:putative membrane protein
MSIALAIYPILWRTRMSSRRSVFFLSTVVAAAGLIAAPWAAAQAASVPAPDRTFAEKAAAGGAAEVDSGRMAQQKATDDRVKQFGARMVQDHSKAGDELKQIGTAKGLKLPEAPDAKADAEKMEKLSGRDFDRAYMNHMVADHKKDVAEFEKEASSGKDPEIKAFAAKTLPTLREHLKMATDTAAAVGK